ncbi:MAG: acyl-CoA thioesterase [Mesorhizobium sp.]
MASVHHDAPYRFWCEEKLRNMDTDQFGHVNNAAIASFCEAGRMSLFAEPEMAGAMGERTVVVVRLLILFRQELFYPGVVRVGSRVPKIGRTSFDVVQGLFKGPELVATSEATCVLLDGRSRRPVPVPESIRQFLLGPGPTGAFDAS